MLTRKDIRTLNKARDVLQRIDKETRRAAWHIEPGDTKVDGYEFGRMGEAADRAESAIFNFLNVSRSWCDETISDEEMHNRKPEAVKV